MAWVFLPRCCYQQKENKLPENCTLPRSSSANLPALAGDFDFLVTKTAGVRQFHHARLKLHFGLKIKLLA